MTKIQVFIQKMGSLVVHCTNDLMKFCTGFVIVYALLRSKVLSMESYVKEVTDILSAFFIPVTEFVDYFNVIKNWKSHLRYNCYTNWFVCIIVVFFYWKVFC